MSLYNSPTAEHLPQKVETVGRGYEARRPQPRAPNLQPDAPIPRPCAPILRLHVRSLPPCAEPATLCPLRCSITLPGAPAASDAGGAGGDSRDRRDVVRGAGAALLVG